MLKDSLYIKTHTLNAALENSGRDLFGYKSKFNGLATVFTTKLNDFSSGNKVEKFEDGVVAAINDGTKSLFTDSEIAEGVAKKISFRNRGGVDGQEGRHPTGEQAVKVRVRVQPTGVKVEVTNPSGAYETVLEQQAEMHNNGYLAFSSYIKDVEAGGFHDTIRL